MHRGYFITVPIKERASNTVHLISCSVPSIGLKLSARLCSLVLHGRCIADLIGLGIMFSFIIVDWAIDVQHTV